jgi:peptidoglycan hydrolase-like protein with peptidoglycan-binding domain
VPSIRVLSGGIALAVGCLLVFSAPVAAGPKVAAVQVALKRLGLYNATVDGVRGPLTKAAIITFQRRRGLAVDGIVGPQTRAAFGKRGRPAFGSRTMNRGDRGWDVAAMQYILARRGYPPGAIDAVFGPMTDAALRNYQRAFGLVVDGLAGPQTIAALRRGRSSRGLPGTTTPVSGPVRLLRPVPGRIGDGFGAPRKGRRTHTGIDFPVQAGTTVRAAGVGVTEFAGWNSGGYGNLVVVRHRLGYTTWYAHLSIITTWVGERVTGGTRLGYVGATGHATGPHLHFELRRNAVPIDPVPYLLAAVATRASSARATSAGTGGESRGSVAKGGDEGGAGPGGSGSVANGSGEGGVGAGPAGHSGGGVAARACPIRKPLVRYRKAPLDACRAKNLTRAR